MSNFKSIIKQFPAEFAKRQVANAVPMAQTRLEYIRGLEADEQFRKLFYAEKTPKTQAQIEEEARKTVEHLLGLSDAEKVKYYSDMEKAEKEKGKVLMAFAKAQNSLYSKDAYELYREGYELELDEERQKNEKLLKIFFHEQKFNSYENCLKFIAAVQKILFNANKSVLRSSIIKLVAFLQFLRSQFYAPEKLLDKNMLIFFSAIGGTGKTELIQAFKKACDKIGIYNEKFSASGLSGRFTDGNIRKVNVGYIEDLDIRARIGNDINLDKFNAIIDRDKIDFERKNKDRVQIQTNITLIASTNNRYFNRRFSVIPLSETEVEKITEAIPTTDELTGAWYDAIVYCPDADNVYHHVKTMNQRNMGVLSEDLLRIYDAFNAERIHTPDEISRLTVTKGTRGIIAYVLGRDSETPRRREFILDQIRTLIANGIIEQVSTAKSNNALQVSKLTADMVKFEHYIANFDDKEKDENATVEALITELYIEPMKLNFKEEIDRCRLKKEQIAKENDENTKKAAEKIDKRIAELSLKEIKDKKLISLIGKYKHKGTS